MDWKSNFLSGYTPAELAESMRECDYVRQYRLYVQALARWLKRLRGPAFDFDRDFGGVYYLFVRGLNGQDESNGVFFHKPTADDLRLERILGDEECIVIPNAMPALVRRLFPQASRTCCTCTTSRGTRRPADHRLLHDPRPARTYRATSRRSRCIGLLLVMLLSLDEGSLCVEASEASLGRRLSDLVGAEAAQNWAGRILRTLNGPGFPALIGSERPVVLQPIGGQRFLYFHKHLKQETVFLEALHSTARERHHGEIGRPDGRAEKRPRRSSAARGGQSVQAESRPTRRWAWHCFGTSRSFPAARAPARPRSSSPWCAAWCAAASHQSASPWPRPPAERPRLTDALRTGLEQLEAPAPTTARTPP